MTDPGLTRIKGELFNLRRILVILDSTAGLSRYNSERVLIELVARLIRVQQQRIQELTARVEFLERDALTADRQHRDELEAYGLLKQRYQQLTERYDLIMERTR